MMSSTRCEQTALAALLLTVLALTAFKPAQAQAPLGYGVLHAFSPLDASNRNADGDSPYGALTPGGDGDLYGVGSQGGTSNDGTIFKMRMDGSGFQTLYSFSVTTNSFPYTNLDGAKPLGALLPGSDGYFYGMAEAGGANGSGTLFKIKPDGSGFTVIYTFSAQNSSGVNTDGATPVNGLTNGGDGFLYGATRFGGAYNGGTIFQVNSDGSVFNSLHSLLDSTDGDEPNGALVAPGDGYLYGTAEFGPQFGTIFRLRTDGTGFLVLHYFPATSNTAPYGNSDGAYPISGLTPGSGGFLYGMASAGGTNGTGTVFKLQTNGSGFQAIYSFSAENGSNDNADGAYPFYSGVTLGPDGLLYGAASAGGPNGNGTVFRLVPDGTGFQTLHAFSARSITAPYNNRDGAIPEGTPVFGPDGFLYGTALSGGSGGTGVLYRVATVHTHLLWDTTDGRASLWTIDILGNVSVSPTYGPYDSGRWQARSLATGPDGRSHLLWSHPSDGSYSVWDITDPNHPSILPTYGPYAGWSAAGLTVGSDGLDRLLWNDSQNIAFGSPANGPAALWTIYSNGSFTYTLYGPYSGASTAAIASSAGGVSHLLWRNIAGQASLWTVGPAGDFLYSPSYGPFDSGRWQAAGLAVGLQGERELLWNHTSDGAASFWRVNAGGYQAIFPATGEYGPYPGYSCVAVTADPVGVPYLLWSHPANGTAAFWKLDAAGDVPGSGTGTSTQAGYGPYSDGAGGFWAPVTASAGP